MREALPPKSVAAEKPDTPEAEQLLAMHEILVEVYGHEDLDQRSYAVYRAEVCLSRLEKKPVPSDFGSVVLELRKCAALQGSDVDECAMRAAGSSPSDEGA